MVTAGYSNKAKHAMMAKKYKEATNTGIREGIEIKRSKAKKPGSMRYNLPSNEKVDYVYDGLEKQNVRKQLNSVDLMTSKYLNL